MLLAYLLTYVEDKEDRYRDQRRDKRPGFGVLGSPVAPFARQQPTEGTK